MARHWQQVSTELSGGIEVLKRISLGIATAAALMFTAQTAEAQRPVTLGVAGGLSAPIGEFGDQREMGWNGTVGLGFHFPTTSVGARLEGFYNSFGNSGVLASGRTSVAGATMNATYDLGGQMVRPYVIGGVGAYNTRLVGGASSTDFGINAGAGMKFGLGAMNTFIEARLHTVAADGDDYQFVPVVFGIEF
jgi:opacity protein-like surface antigen